MGPLEEHLRSENGHQQSKAPSPATPQPRFVEDEDGATMDSGAAVCYFNARQGGRLQRWQWRTLPPRMVLEPATRHNAPLLLDLVDPERGALIDHFLPLGSKPEQFAAGEYQEYGDFADGPFRKQMVDSGGEIRIGLLRDGEIHAGKRVAEVRLAKSAALRPDAPDIAVLYRIINSSLRPLQILFAVEFNLFAPGLSEPDKSADVAYYLIDGQRPDDGSLGSLGVSPGATHVALVNPVGEMGLQLGWDRECDLWRLPPADGGSGARLLSVWRIQLPPRDNWAMGLWLAPG
jgi:hypothetical protein